MLGSGPSEDTPPPEDGRSARSGRELLVRSPYGAYFFGKLLWATGVWVFTVTTAILMYSLTESAFLVGVASFSQYLPLLVLSPSSGARADRRDPQRQAAFSRALMAVGSTVLAVQLLLGDAATDTTVIVLLIAAVTFGTGDAIGAPAAQALVPTLVRPAELPTAIELDAIPFTLARALGPLLGAAIAAAISSAYAYLYSALVCLAFAALLVRLRPERPRPMRDRLPGEDSVLAGLRYLRTQPRLVVLLIGVTAVGFGVDPVVTLTPALVAVLGGEPASVAAMASAFGTGAGVMLLALRAVRKRIGVHRVAPLGLGVLGLTMLLLTVVPDVTAAIAVVGVGGAGYAMAITSLTTMLQSDVDDAMRGRVMAFWSVTYFGSRPIAAAVHGSVAELASVRAALLVTTTLILTGAIVVARRRGSVA